MPQYTRACQSITEYARVYRSMPEYARGCQSMPEYNRVWQSMKECTADGAYHCPVGSIMAIFSSVRSSNSHPDLLVIHPPTTPLFQITPVLNTGLSLSEPLQLYKGYNAI